MGESGLAGKGTIKTNLGFTNASLFLALIASKLDIRQQLNGLIFDVLNFFNLREKVLFRAGFTQDSRVYFPRLGNVYLNRFSFI